MDWIYNLGFEDGLAWIQGRNVGRSPHAVKKLRKPIARNTAHDFDTPRQVSVHRFLGYNPKEGYSRLFIGLSVRSSTTSSVSELVKTGISPANLR